MKWMLWKSAGLNYEGFVLLLRTVLIEALLVLLYESNLVSKLKPPPCLVHPVSSV